MTKVEKLLKALTDIKHCLGFCPEHLGADNYEDPGIIFAQSIIEDLRKTAEYALKEYNESE